MKRIFLYLPFLLILVCSCQPLRVQTSIVSARPQNPTGQIRLLEKEDLPDNASLLGNVYVGGTIYAASVDCSYDKCMDKIYSEARNIGGNVIVIKQHLLPGSTNSKTSNCHHIMSDIYYIPENE